ncbi:glycoside hydrolase, family GH25 [Tenacibaculum sp. 190524A02b]|uniref:GH25 family lysozyme n=1 Tax=Tenacibaculum vairaonense TaxID=3137860 RepID=UPI0032B25BD4
MKTFNDFDKKMLQEISAFHKDGIIDLKRFLESIFFNKSLGKALIVQLNEQYAMYFLTVEIYNNNEKKKIAIQELSQLVALLDYLNTKGIISIFRDSHYLRERMFFISNEFDNPKIEHTKLILNAHGWYSAKPEEIRDNTNTIVYKGIQFNDSFFIIKNMVGKLIVSDKIFELLKEKIPETVPYTEPKKPEIIEPQISFFKKYKHTLLIWIPALLLLSISSFFFNHHHKKTKQLLQKYDSITNHIATKSLSSKTKPVQKKYGIDVSRWNGTILNTTLPDSLGFIICKATEGVTLTDPKFTYNWQRISELQLKRGAYHFYITKDSPVEQASFFWKHIKNRKNKDFPPIVDIESASSITDDENIQKNLLSFLTHLENLSGVTPMIYSSYYYANAHLTDKRFAKYGLWIADYDSSVAPKIPIVWRTKGWILWQKTSTFSINSHLSDLNVYNVNLK